MLIDVRLTMMFLLCFFFGGITLGLVITKMYYGKVAEDARAEIKRNNRMWEKELREANDGWYEFYTNLINNERRHTDDSVKRY